MLVIQAVPLIQDLPEYKALEDEEGRRAAFAKFVKRQKVAAFPLPVRCEHDLSSVYRSAFVSVNGRPRRTDRRQVGSAKNPRRRTVSESIVTRI